MKIAMVFVCLNQPYWKYLFDVVEDAKKNFLPGHQVDMFAWSDIPSDMGTSFTVFPTESIPWPYPTLMRYHLFLQQEDILKTYDYIFYCDADMRIVDIVGDEILGQGLTMAEHPMYALSPRYIPPYEPDSGSTAYIKRLGVTIADPVTGQPRFKPLYAAGGFQGGTSESFIKAMHVMKDNIDADFAKNYIAIWNDESHWNKYLSEYSGHLVVLSPSYVYPDSLIQEYYNPIWGREYVPKIITLTKPFTISKEGGDAVRQTIEDLGKIQP